MSKVTIKLCADTSDGEVTHDEQTTEALFGLLDHAGPLATMDIIGDWIGRLEYIRGYAGMILHGELAASFRDAGGGEVTPEEVWKSITALGVDPMDVAAVGAFYGAYGDGDFYFGPLEEAFYAWRDERLSASPGEARKCTVVEFPGAAQ